MLFVSLALGALSVLAEWNENGPLANIAHLYHSGKLEEAERAMEEHIKTYDVYPGPDTTLLAARISLARGHRRRAMALVRQCVSTHPKDHRLYFFMGVEHTRLGRGGEAVACLRKSIELNRNHAASYLWLAKTTVPREQKIRALQKVLVLEERDSPMAKQAVKMLDKLKDKKDAQQVHAAGRLRRGGPNVR